MSTTDVSRAKSAATAVHPDIATPTQVAEFLHTTTAALAQDRYHNRGIAYVKHGRKVLYRWADVHLYLEANTINPGAA
ncbi:DNA-binding protein [Gordonia sp. i37]|uniref:DNA-binding protein n=1 Tax=Gordonia sp. i37 TaxID=1961707 RepID=UPI0009AD5D57|nr:DNA-binding protein [Gordonia sp. i37]OPX17038.1 DNA-binding protein [Gordonia sp. i37]